jgi:hypothetical protein
MLGWELHLVLGKVSVTRAPVSGQKSFHVDITRQKRDRFFTPCPSLSGTAAAHGGERDAVSCASMIATATTINRRPPSTSPMAIITPPSRLRTATTVTTMTTADGVTRGAGAEGPELALKKPTVAPVGGLLTEAVLKHAALCRTAAHDPKATSDLSTTRPMFAE